MLLSAFVACKANALSSWQLGAFELDKARYHTLAKDAVELQTLHGLYMMGGFEAGSAYRPVSQAIFFTSLDVV